jgi:3-oxoacyl-[acyl-carrier protein] reductase
MLGDEPRSRKNHGGSEMQEQGGEPGHKFDPRGAVAVIAGGSGGIGAATARALALEGAHVVVGYRSGEQRAHDVVRSLPGNRHRALRLPVTDSAAVSMAAAEVRTTYGRCDVLVNSAGTTRAISHRDLDALDDETFDQIYRTNVRGPFATVRAFAPLLRERQGAVIVNVSSVSGQSGSGSSIAYCASKGALDTMTRSLGRALAPEIRVIGVAPAAVATDFVPNRSLDAVRQQAATTPLQVVVEPEDVALSVLAVITHLTVSTGTTIEIDGGRHL